MALGSVIGAIAAPVIGGLASSLLGGSSNKAIAKLGKQAGVGINAGGLASTVTGSGKNRSISLTASPERTGVVNRLAATYPELAARMAALRGEVTPGFGRLTAARVAAVENARRAGVGNLKETLARRRVLGSSFAADAITRANLEFGQEEAKVRAQSFLEELALSNELLGQEYAARRGEVETLLGELNLQSEAAIKLATGATAEAGANARQQAQLAQQSLAGIGAAVEPAANAIGSGIAKLLTPTPTLSAAGAGIY